MLGSTAQIVKLWGHSEHISPSVITDANDRKLTSQVLNDFFSFWAEHDHVATGDNIIRTEFVRMAGGMLEDLRISQDLEYWGYLATFGKWGFIPEPHIIRDGTLGPAVHGLLNKYRRRWRLAPDVEQWQRRILPRLREQDMPGFRIVRARVGCGFAHAKILAGDDDSAHTIILRHGNDFPKGRIPAAMLRGARMGSIGWKFCCHLIRFRELLKALFISANYALRTKKTEGFSQPQ